MEDFLKLAKKLVDEKQAYVCSCDGELMKKNRFKGIDCDCISSGSGQGKFEEFLKAKEGSCVVRIHIDMAHKNSAMRDPAIFRIIEAEHCRLGKKYRAWPTYDFENAVMDGKTGVTHRLRSKEFELRNELQRHIQRTLGFPETKIFEFARFNMEGVESSGRKIRELITEGKLSGWDDPSLTTLVALRRRGFQPQAIKDFVISTGISKAESVLTWSDLEVHNKRLLDAEAERHFFIADPVHVTIKGAPVTEVTLKKHPNKDLGIRTFSVDEQFVLAKSDVDGFEDGKLYRLMDHCNFKKEGETYTFLSLSVDDYRKEGKAIIHWLPAAGMVDASVLMPDHTVVKGLAEPQVAELKEGTVFQCERFGFVRVDEQGKKTKMWFTHK